MSNLAQAITAMIAAALPRPNIVEGFVDSVEMPVDVTTRVTVSGIADVPIACDWSANFDLELSARGRDLVGSAVEVHLIDGQPVIAYSKVSGVKP